MSKTTLDTADVVLNIDAAANTAESNAWVKMLLRMYCYYCKSHNFKYEIVADQPGRVVMVVTGAYYSRFMAEHGVHRLSRISPFDANKRRHSSFAAVNVAEAGHGPADPCSQHIRSYILSPHCVVKELRTGYATDDPQNVLDGDLDPFIDAWLKSNS